MTDVLIVLITAPGREEGERIGAALVEEQLAACVNLLGPIRSIYRWKGEVCREDEHLLVVKTVRRRFAALEQRVRALHPYETPEIIAFPVERGFEEYLQWVRSESTPRGG